MTRIVALGGGYVTVSAYRALHRQLRLHPADVEFCVVGRENYHTYHGWTGEVVAGILPLAHRNSPLRAMLPHARLVCGEAIGVDLQRRSVTVRLSGTAHLAELPYDHLVFGTGSHDQVAGVSGLAEHGWRVKSPAELLVLRNHLLGLLEQADALSEPAAAGRLLTVVVVGGGFAGVELCAAIAELFAAARRHYPALRRQPPRLVLVHGGDRLLPQLGERFARLARYATRQLGRWGVELRLGVRLAAVMPAGALLSDGTRIPSATVIASTGQALTPLPGTESLPHDSSGRLLTDSRLNVAGTANLWAGGDCALVIHPGTGQPCPANALWAIKHGELVGGNLARCLSGRPLRPFRYPGLGQAASLGVGKGAVELYGRQFTGWVGWLMRLCFFLYFMPSRRQALRVLCDWLLLPLAGRDLMPVDCPTPVQLSPDDQSVP